MRINMYSFPSICLINKCLEINMYYSILNKYIDVKFNTQDCTRINVTTIFQNDSDTPFKMAAIKLQFRKVYSKK